MEKLSWIQISDLHMGQRSQWLWPNFKATFMEDLRRIAGESGPTDLVIFSGDLVNRGERTEFTALTGELLELWELWDKLGAAPLLFSVPGNHDLVRPPANDARMKMLTRWSNEPDVIKEFWADSKNQYRTLVKESFSNYLEWQNDVNKAGIPLAPLTEGLLPGDASSSFRVNGLSVGLVGLNSSFLQLNDSDFRGRLVLDARQIVAVTNGNQSAWCAENDINFLVTHHPTSWLNTDALRDYQSEIYSSGRFTAHFFGHMHDADMIMQHRAGSAGRRQVQSASLFGLELLGDGKTERVHGYSAGKISFTHDSAEWKFWPRVAKTNRSGDRKLIPDFNFEIEAGTEYQREIFSRTKAPTAIPSQPNKGTDLAVAVEGTPVEWSESLQSTASALITQEQHKFVRIVQQQACVEIIRQKGIAWVCADWGLGRSGFIWSVLNRMNRDGQPIYRVALDNYASRADFLAKFSSTTGCSFPEYCRALGTAGPGVLLLDDAPVSIGEPSEKPIERDVESLAEMVRDFCPDIQIFLLARTAPRQNKIGAVLLDAFDEPETRTYLINHPTTTPEVTSPSAVSIIHSRTDGLPSRIDTTLKTLRVVSLPELAVVTMPGQSGDVVSSESIPASLVKAVAELSTSDDPNTKRSFLLLKVLAILPHGETLQRLKRIDSDYPIFPKHAEELLDRDLIQIRSSTSLIGDGIDSARLKVLVAPRPVRDYVLSQMSEKEVNNLVRKATNLYFGDTWRTGIANLNKTKGALASDDGSLLENPHLLVLRLLNNPATWESPEAGAAVLNLCNVYATALSEGKHYRNCATVCRDVLSTMPNGGFEKERQSMEFMLASSLRMSGEYEEAKEILEKLLHVSWPKANQIQLLLRYALTLQSLNSPKAFEVAEQIISLTPNTAPALQAKSIILEMEEDADNSSRLLRLEKEARRKGYTTIANNLTLGRVSGSDNDSRAEKLLKEVHSTASRAGDAYTAARASVKIGHLKLRETGTLVDSEISNLIEAYQYFYGERSENIFLSAHKTLWDFFEEEGDIRNLLSLFRHSSFIWRLHDNEEIEQFYAKRLIEKARHILSTDIVTADKNTAYFLVRVRNASTEIDE